MFRFQTAIALALFFLSPSLFAEVRLASPFTSHMVLQRDKSIPVWGAAEPGERVTVEFAGQKRSALADANGHWRLELKPLKTSEHGRVFIVSGSKTAQPIQLDDVLVGEVWLASGQSNMEFTMSKAVKHFAGVTNEEAEIAAASDPLIRMFTGALTTADQPQDRVAGQWEVCTPETAPAFSAVAYFFARDLQKEIKVPVGIVTLAYGASTAEAWVQREALAADPELKPMLERFDAAVEKFRSNPAEIESARRSEDVSSTNAPPRRRRHAPRDPAHDQHSPTVLFNAMIHPVVPFAIRGVIWYQGESIVGGDAGRALYPRVQAALVRNWRKLWGEGDFPFYIVQLAALKSNSNNPLVREAQATVLSLPNTGMAVTIDIGEPHNVHPKNKQDVGNRLARIALANVYGRKIEFSGPRYEGFKIDGNAIRLKFSHVDGGLVARGGELKTFEVAGADGTYFPADARIDGKSVVVSSAKAPAPVSARYAWANYPAGCNFYNAAGLPAAPFRTDAPKFQIK